MSLIIDEEIIKKKFDIFLIDTLLYFFIKLKNLFKSILIIKLFFKPPYFCIISKKVKNEILI